MNLFILFLILLITLFGWLYYQAVKIVAMFTTDTVSPFCRTMLIAKNAFITMLPYENRDFDYYRGLFTGQMYASVCKVNHALNTMSEEQHDAFNQDLIDLTYVIGKFGTVRITTPIALRVTSTEVFLSELAKVQAAFHNLQHGDGRDPLAREWFNQSRAFADQHHFDLNYVIETIDNWLTTTSTDHWLQKVYFPIRDAKGASHD